MNIRDFSTALALAVALASCDSGSIGEPSWTTDIVGAHEVLEALEASGTISSSQRIAGDSLLAAVGKLQDSLKSAPRQDDLGYWWAGYLQESVDRLVDYHHRALLDSTRTSNLLDQVAVTAEYVRGTLERSGEQYFPVRTPHLTWVFYGGTGIFFQPVTTVERIAGIPLPNPAAPLDSLKAAGDALWAHAVWHDGTLGPFPVWEYDFSYRTNYLDLRAPWRSGMAQGEVLKLYSELYRRTGQDLWLERASAVFRSMMTPWPEGGMLSPDTTHGYWWDEYDPAGIIWNGSIVALIGVGLYAEASGDADAEHAWNRGLEAARYWTPFIDDGSWTRYSILTGYVNPPYHAWHISLADALFTLSGDPLWQDYADRWRTYTPPTAAAQEELGPIEAVGSLP